MRKVRIPLPQTNLGVVERLHKKGVTWILLFIAIFATNQNHNYLFRFVDAITFVLQIILVVELYNKVLIRHFLAERKIVLFIIFSFFSIAIAALISAFIELALLHYVGKVPFNELRNPEAYPYMLFVFRLLWFSAVYAIAMIFYYQKKENEDKIVADQLKSEKLNMELRYLKSQINPHFLFNALNNIYSMVYTHDDNAADGVLKLSEMLRYVLVDCQADMIPLNKEVKYVESSCTSRKTS